MARLAMNAGELFVFYRDSYEKGKAAGNISDGGGTAWQFGNYYNIIDEDGEEWLKRVNVYYACEICCITGKATSLDMTFKTVMKFNEQIGAQGNSIAAIWGLSDTVNTQKGDSGLCVFINFTSKTNLQIKFGTMTGWVGMGNLSKMLPAYSMGGDTDETKHTANVTIADGEPQEIAASYDAKTRRLIVTVNGQDAINQIFSGTFWRTMPALEDWPTGYAGVYFGRNVQIKNIYLEYPTEGGEDEPEEEWRPLAEINRMGGDAPLFALLIESEGCEPLAIAQGYKDVWLKDANGEARLFTASGMTIELPERKAGSAAALNFGIADVSGEAMARCEQLRDNAHPVYVTCLEYASHGGKDAASAPEPVWHLRLFGTSAAITPKGATFSAGWHDTLNAKYPYRRYTAAQFPGLKYVSSSI